jgi:hypothetical protein
VDTVLTIRAFKRRMRAAMCPVPSSDAYNGDV